MNPHLNIEMWGTRDHEKLSKLISEGDGDNDIQIKVNRHWIAVLMGLLIQLAVAQSTTASRTNAAFPRFTQTEGDDGGDSGKPVHMLKAERQEIIRMLEAK